MFTVGSPTYSVGSPAADVTGSGVPWPPTVYAVQPNNPELLNLDIFEVEPPKGPQGPNLAQDLADNGATGSPGSGDGTNKDPPQAMIRTEESATNVQQENNDDALKTEPKTSEGLLNLSFILYAKQAH